MKNDSAEILSCHAGKYEGYCTLGRDGPHIVRGAAESP
jgi:hypothetical protein